MKQCFIGVDFGKTNVRFAIAEDEPALTCYTKRPYTRGTPEDVSRQIVDGIDRTIEEAGYTPDAVRGIGIAVATRRPLPSWSGSRFCSADSAPISY